MTKLSSLTHGKRCSINACRNGRFGGNVSSFTAKWRLMTCRALPIQIFAILCNSNGLCWMSRLRLFDSIRVNRSPVMGLVRNQDQVGVLLWLDYIPGTHQVYGSICWMNQQAKARSRVPPKLTWNREAYKYLFLNWRTCLIATWTKPLNVNIRFYQGRPCLLYQRGNNLFGHLAINKRSSYS